MLYMDITAGCVCVCELLLVLEWEFYSMEVFRVENKTDRGQALEFNSSLRVSLSLSLSLCAYVFIKLHMTAQSGAVILVILYHSHSPSQGGINGACHKINLIRPNEGD